MKVLKLLNGMHYWGDLLPSQSFLNKMATALTEQIEILIESPKFKKICKVSRIKFRSI